MSGGWEGIGVVGGGLGGGCRSKRKAAKRIFSALRSERIVWESEPITGQTGWGMGRHGEGHGEVLASI